MGAWKDELMRIQQQKQEESEDRRFEYGCIYGLKKPWQPFFKIIPEKGMLLFEPAGLMYENSDGEVRLDDLEKYLDLSVCEYPVEFVEEPENPYDANAIKIYAIHQLGLKVEVGYVPRNPYTDYHSQFNEWFAENRQYFKDFYFYYDKDFNNYLIKGELKDEHKSSAEKIFSPYENVIKKDLEEKRKREEAEKSKTKVESQRETMQKVKPDNRKRKEESTGSAVGFVFQMVFWIIMLGLIGVAVVYIFENPVFLFALCLILCKDLFKGT